MRAPNWLIRELLSQAQKRGLSYLRSSGLTRGSSRVRRIYDETCAACCETAMDTRIPRGSENAIAMRICQRSDFRGSLRGAASTWMQRVLCYLWCM